VTGSLTGLKVIEMAGIGPCPLAGQLLADHGAEVFVIDRDSGATNPADVVNRRGKHSIALNLKSPEGISTIKRLVAEVDVLIEGYRPGVMERLGLGPDVCHEINPRLIIGRMTGWGQVGPLSLTAGHDLNYLAVTGALRAMGPVDQPPPPPLNLVADYGGGTMFLLFGILMALYERGKSDKGQVVDAAMVDGVSVMLSVFHGLLAANQITPDREANLLDGAAPFYRCYETKDGHYLSVGCIEPQFFAEFLRLAGLPEEHLSTQYDEKTWPQLRADIKNLFLQKNHKEWMEIFDGTDACIAPVLDWNNAVEHPHIVERGIYVEVDGVMQANAAPRLSRTPAGAPKGSGNKGADTQIILKRFGFLDSEISSLIHTGALL
jgi:alpha-methylacyl-CoA racemase